MPDRIYIETSIVSYLTGRPSRDVVIAGHQQTTHEWWDTRRASYELCTSEAVLEEAASGDPEAAQDRLDVLNAMTFWRQPPKQWRSPTPLSRREHSLKTPPTMLYTLPYLPRTEYHIY